MRGRLIDCVAALLVAMGAVSGAAAAPLPPVPAYPATERQAIDETRFGLTVSDPYRWLEGDPVTDPKVRAWMLAQNAAARAYLEALPQRRVFADRLAKLWDVEVLGVPRTAGGHLFFTRNTGLQKHAPLYVQDAGGVPRLLLDPNAWPAEAGAALAQWEPSSDGRLVAYAVQERGSDWRTLRVLDVATGRTLPDEVRWAKFTNITWMPDGSGFFYSRYAEPTGSVERDENVNHRIFFHRLGDPQSADRLLFALPEKPLPYRVAELSGDGRWLFVLGSTSSTNDSLYLVDLTTPGAPPRLLADSEGEDWQFVGSHGSRAWFTTTRGAGRYRIVSVDSARPDAGFTQVVPEARGTIQRATMAGDVLVVSRLEDVQSALDRYTLDGRSLGRVTLPGVGSLAVIPSSRTGSTFLGFESFNRPRTIYRLDAASGRLSLHGAPRLLFEPDRFEVRQILYRSKDGTQVPMFVMHRRGLKLTGGVRTVLWGYGGFNLSPPPRFSPAWLAWMEAGGVFAQANIRGGGEYGRAWHEAGRARNIQNAFDDFIAAAERLIADGVTTPAKLAIQGVSHGGLIMGAVTNQRPELFAAVLPAVGVFDPVRISLFVNGSAGLAEYGDPNTADGLAHLLRFSPIHNVRGGSGRSYPAVLVAAAERDDRLSPLHSFKYAATLQGARDIGKKPKLLAVTPGVGHGPGTPTSIRISEAADWLAFTAAHTGLKAGSEDRRRR